MVRKFFWIGITIGAVFLSGCEGNLRALQDWAQEKNMPSHGVTFEWPVIFEGTKPFFASQGIIIDPFAISRLNGFSVTLDEQLSQDLFDAPQEGQYLSPLKNIVLQKIKLVGTVVHRKERIALITYKEKTYLITVGLTIGKNRGIVTDIREDAIQIREIVDNGLGKFVPRITTISTALLKK